MYTTQLCLEYIAYMTFDECWDGYPKNFKLYKLEAVTIIDTYKTQCTIFFNSIQINLFNTILKMIIVFLSMFVLL